VSPRNVSSEEKQYFRVPVEGTELPPYGVSQPARVRLRNPYYTILFTPALKVRGQRKLSQAKDAEAVQSLTEALTKKGVLTKEEAAAINRRPPANQPVP